MSENLTKSPQYSLSLWLNIAGLCGICAALLVAFFYQLSLFELPCPLCLLQRAGLMLIGFGFLLNLRFGIKSRHYSMALVGCVVTGIIAVRQVFLHILPGDAGYGSAFLGLHFYTWALIAAIITTIAVAVMLALHQHDTSVEAAPKSLFAKLVIILFTLIIAANLLSTVLECGGGQCDDNPTFYQLLK
jgi:disulfide bond formation protein DsbB